MLPTSAMTMKPGADLKSGEIGLLVARNTTLPVIGGITQAGVPVIVQFDGDKVRLQAASDCREPVMILEGAEIELDPRSARKASPGSALGCPLLSGANLSIEADYEMQFFQIAIGAVEDVLDGYRLAFDRWRIVVRHGAGEYELMSRNSEAH